MKRDLESLNMVVKHRWIVLFAAFAVSFLVDGILYAFGVLLIGLTEELDESIASVAALGGIYLGCAAFTAPFAGSLSDAYSKRFVTLLGTVFFSTGLFASIFASNIVLLYLTYGGIGGIGHGFMYTASVAYVIEHFEEHQQCLACGIAMCGSGVGGFVMSLVTKQLLDEFGLRGTFLICSGIMLNGIPCGLVFQQSKTPKKTTETDEQSVSVKETITEKILRIVFKNNIAIFRNFQCFCILVSMFLFGLSYFAPMTFLPKQAISLGLGKDKAAWLLSALGITNTVGRGAFGWLGNREFIHRTTLLKLLLLLIAISFPTSFLLGSFDAKLMFACVYGILVGGCLVYLPLALTDVVSAAKVGKATGLYVLVACGGMLIGSPIKGWTIDATGSFEVCFCLAGIEIFLALLLLVLPTLRRICCTRGKRTAEIITDTL